jgi:hypothetical protein
MTVTKRGLAAGFALLLGSMATMAAAADGTPERVSAPVTTGSIDASPVGQAPIGATAQQLRKLIADGVLDELRTTYNGHYGASLLFHGDKLTYYVALFHDKTFWRVIRTSSQDEAEQAYRAFSRQTENLARVDIQRITLAAQNAYTEYLLGLNERHAQLLQDDLAAARAQAQQVAEQQQRAHQQTAELTSQQQKVNAELDSLQQRIRLLEKQQSDLNMGLPGVESPPPAHTTPLHDNP